MTVHHPPRHFFSLTNQKLFNRSPVRLAFRKIDRSFSPSLSPSPCTVLCCSVAARCVSREIAKGGNGRDKWRVSGGYLESAVGSLSLFSLSSVHSAFLSLSSSSPSSFSSNRILLISWLKMSDTHVRSTGRVHHPHRIVMARLLLGESRYAGWKEEEREWERCRRDRYRVELIAFQRKLDHVRMWKFDVARLQGLRFFSIGIKYRWMD